MMRRGYVYKINGLKYEGEEAVVANGRTKNKENRDEEWKTEEKGRSKRDE